MPWIEEGAHKQAVILQVLGSLPDWFGIPEAIDEYVLGGQAMPCYVHEVDGEAVGFVSLKQTSECAAEIHVMGILPAYHRQGIGRQMIEACEAEARCRGLSLLHVKTVDPQAQYDSYLRTHAFYRAMGFLPLEVLPLWDEHNPCLLLVKPL